MDAEELCKKKGVGYRLVKLSAKGISFEDVVKYAKEGLNLEEICKTIVVKDKRGNKFGFFLKGNQKIDFAKAREIIGLKISIVSYEDLKIATGTEPGAVCPLILDFPLFVDKKIFETEKINFGSGDHLFGLEINSKELVKLVDFKIVEVSQN